MCQISIESSQKSISEPQLARHTVKNGLTLILRLFPCCSAYLDPGKVCLYFRLKHYFKSSFFHVPPWKWLRHKPWNTNFWNVALIENVTTLFVGSNELNKPNISPNWPPGYFWWHYTHLAPSTRALRSVVGASRSLSQNSDFLNFCEFRPYEWPLTMRICCLHRMDVLRVRGARPTFCT